jgi:hypothetical protein
MKRLFWIQNENPNIPNTIIDNEGKKISLHRSEDDGNKLFNELLNYQETFKTIYSSQNLSIKKRNNGGIFISSNFLEKDESGRRMGFMFFTEQASKKNIINDLLFFSGQVKRTLADQDLNDINRTFDNNNKEIIKLIAAAIAILLIYIVWKELN